MSKSSEYKTIPYDELLFRWKDGEQSFTLTTLWHQIEMEYRPSDKDKVSAFASLFDSKEQPKKWLDHQWILKDLAPYPLVHISPRKFHQIKWSTILREARISKEIENPLSLLKKISYIIPKKNPTNQIMSQNWRWSVKPIKEFSSIAMSPFYDSLSVFSSIRRLWQSDKINYYDSSYVINKLENLLALNTSNFIEVAKLFVIQNHYIGKTSPQSLKPALQISALSGQVQTMMASMQERDSRLNDCLKYLEVKESDLENVFWQSKAIMELLKYAARHHALAFACLIDLFESGSQNPDHALAMLLRLSTKVNQTSNDFPKQQNTNFSNHYDQGGFCLATGLGAVDSASLKAATLMTEMAVRLETSMLQRLEHEIDKRLLALQEGNPSSPPQDEAAS